jgi:hypothetical protein
MLSLHSGQVMNIICSDQAVGWIGASPTGPRGPANRATRLRVTGAFLEKQATGRLLTVYPRSRAEKPRWRRDDRLGHRRSRGDDLLASRDSPDAIALTDGRAEMVDEVLAAGQLPPPTT